MLSVFCAGTQLYAQQNTDSLRLARQKEMEIMRAEQKRLLDSTQKERQRILDSTRVARDRYLDSLRTAREAEMERLRIIRERRSDSLAAIRKYKGSRKYKDSVASVRQARLDSIQAVRQAYTDSIKKERKRVTDSLVAKRKRTTDSIRAIQKARSDSLAKIRAYRESKRYKDSVQVVRQLRLDSIKAVRTAYFDSVKAERQRVTDSITAVRKAYTDSLSAARKAYTDSLTAARKVRNDSLAKMKEKREKEKKIREKQREEKTKLAFELKIKKKQEAYNNENMLKKRWGFPRSVLQNTYTRYNYYFNADQKMNEALDNMQRFRRENYDSLLALYPFNPDRDSSVLAPDMDSIIHKASLGIQIHDPRTKWGDDLYLLLGQAYYYKGDYKNAGDAFKYVVSLRDKKEKSKKRNSRKRTKPKSTSIVVEEKKGVAALLMHESVHNEAILWLARVYTQQHKEGEAESVLDLVQTDPNFTGSLAGRVALEMSFIRLNQEDFKGAIAPLKEVTEDKKLPDWIRMRAAYINGQLQQRFGEYTASAESFETVQDLHPNVDMDFYAKKNRATSLMMAGGAQEDAVALLRNLLKDGKYNKYYEQVYYLLGRLSVNGGNTEDAITYFNKGINSPKSTGDQKAMSYTALGNVYYDQRKYEYAKNAYDSAAAFIGDNADTEEMQTALRRSVVLGNLTDPLRTIRYNDSLLDLSSKDEKEQRSIVRKYIKMLEDRLADSIFRAENSGLAAARSANNNNNKKNNFANWYFSNPVQMQKGFNDFKQKWGSRPAADNWRRSSAGGFAQRDLTDGNDQQGDNANGIPTEESLMAAIPKTPAEKDSALFAIRQAYMAAANAYVKDLEDYPPALSLMDTFDRRFPKHEYDAETIYLRYVIALKQGKFDEAKAYNETLQAEYADTKWAKLVKPTEDGAGMNEDQEGVVTYYDKTYSLLLDREYNQALPRAQEGQRRYTIPVYQDRFQIIEATAEAMLENYPVADSILNVFLTGHTSPEDSLRRWADALLKYVNEKKAIIAKQQQDSIAAVRAADTTNRPIVDSTGKVIGLVQGGEASVVQPASGVVPAEYKVQNSDEHFVLFSFKTMEQRTKGVEVAIEDFNKFKFGSLNLQSEVNMLNAGDGLIIVKTFQNKNQALMYLNTLKKTKQIFREYQSAEYNVVLISKSNYNKLVTEKDFNAYLRFYKSKY